MNQSECILSRKKPVCLQNQLEITPSPEIMLYIMSPDSCYLLQLPTNSMGCITTYKELSQCTYQDLCFMVSATLKHKMEKGAGELHLHPMDSITDYTDGCKS